MHFANSSQNPWSNSKLPVSTHSRPRSMGNSRKPEHCGWYNSSLDLAQGLEVSEEDSDTLYQLWELAQR